MSIPKIALLCAAPDKHPDGLQDHLVYDDITENETEDEYLERKAIGKGDNYMFFFKNKDGIMKLRYHHPHPENIIKKGVLDVEELPNGAYKLVNIPNSSPPTW